MAADECPHVSVLIQDAHATNAKALHQDFLQEPIAQVRVARGIGKQQGDVTAAAGADGPGLSSETDVSAR